MINQHTSDYELRSRLNMIWLLASGTAPKSAEIDQTIELFHELLEQAEAVADKNGRLNELLRVSSDNVWLRYGGDLIPINKRIDDLTRQRDSLTRPNHNPDQAEQS